MMYSWGMTNTSTHLATAITEVRGEIARSDTKASSIAAVAALLLSVGGAALVTVHLPTPALITGWTGTTLLAAAVTALTLALRPRLTPARGSWTLLAHSTPADIADHYDQPSVLVPDQAAQLQALAAMGRAKYQLLRIATDLLLAGIATAVITGLLALIYA